MCGIVGYVGPKPVQDVLLAGLEKLEYRGYDSAGVSVWDEGRWDTVRAVGNLGALKAAVLEPAHVGGREAAAATATATITCGIGHTRWATHGRVSVQNAHPVADAADQVHVVVNGIVENYLALKHELQAQGAPFTSETDVEVIAHLVAREYEGDLVAAVRRAYALLEGHYALVVGHAAHPDELVAARKECPLIIGRGDGESFIGSAVPAFLAHTREVQVIENDEVVHVRAEAVEFTTADGLPLEREVTHIDWDLEAAEKGGFETFTLKEVYEQPLALAETIDDRVVAGDSVDLGIEPDPARPIDDAFLTGVQRIIIVACGTAYHAGLVAKYAIEEWARLPVEIDVASEYRYRNPVIGEGDLAIGISQSGETADTLAALRLCHERGARTLAVTNVMGSQITRDADGVLYTRAGLEIGVASTKCFTAQVAAVELLALRLAELRGTLERPEIARLIGELKALPAKVERLLEETDGPTTEAAEAHFDAEFFLYLGRHVGYAVGVEGALKLKELSYIATDAYAAGEMKHGPIALLSDQTPVVVAATKSPVYDKVISNVQEVRARGAHVIAVAGEDDETIEHHAESVLRIPEADWMVAPILSIIPLQLLAYKIARRRGLNVDQPRNLAKTVTVE